MKDNGQMMKVPAPAAVVPMRIREILRCQNQRNKRSENNPRLHNSRRNPPNYPAKQQPNYPPVRRESRKSLQKSLWIHHPTAVRDPRATISMNGDPPSWALQVQSMRGACSFWISPSLPITPSSHQRSRSVRGSIIATSTVRV